MSTAEIIVLVGAIIPIVGNLVAFALRRYGYHAAADRVDLVTPIAARLGTSKSREDAIASAADLLRVAADELGPDHWIAPSVDAVRAELQPKRPSKPPSVPPLSCIAFLFLVGCVPFLSGCGAPPLQIAAGVANAAADTGNAAAPVLREHCVEPMQAAAAAQDRARARTVAERCDAPVGAYESLRVAHVALRGTIVAVAAGGDPGKLLLLVADVSAAAQDLARVIAGITKGTP